MLRAIKAEVNPPKGGTQRCVGVAQGLLDLCGPCGSEHPGLNQPAKFTALAVVTRAAESFSGKGRLDRKLYIASQSSRPSTRSFARELTPYATVVSFNRCASVTLFK